MAQTVFEQHPEWRTGVIEGLAALTDSRPHRSRGSVIAILVMAAVLVGWAF